MTSKAIGIPQTTVDENGKFSYYSSDMRPVPPGVALLIKLTTNPTNCQARVQVQGLSQISKRPGPGA